VKLKTTKKYYKKLPINNADKEGIKTDTAMHIARSRTSDKNERLASQSGLATGN
jgi:hypothetical protein